MELNYIVHSFFVHIVHKLQHFCNTFSDRPNLVGQDHHYTVAINRIPL